MIIFDASIRKCKRRLAALYAEKHELENKQEDMRAVAGGKLDSLISQIDSLIEGDYAQAVFDHYSGKKPLLIRIHTGEEVQWLDAFGDTFDKTTPGQRHALVGLIEGGSKYRFK